MACGGPPLNAVLAAAGVMLLACVSAAPAADEIHSLPGWKDALPSRMWSGHIDVGGDTQDGVARTMHMWYMFVAAEGAADPTTLPVVLWSNGGPGASSAYGLFTELGPFTLSSESMRTSPPTLLRNPYSWSRLANILILNGPAPVGYSYCEPAGPGGDGESCGSWNDTRTNEFNVVFVERFMALFPEFARAPFFVTGESYAGVYTGMLVDSLLAKRSSVNVRGLALGDACMGTEVLCGEHAGGPWLSLLFAAGQGCIALATFDAILTQCPLPLLQNGPMSSATPACTAAVARASLDCPGNAYYSYNYLDQCPPDPFSSPPQGGAAVGAPPAPAQPSGYPCGGGSALKAWITHPDTKKALNVAADSAYWSFDNGAGFVYNVTWPSNLPLLRRLQTGADGVRVLVYNGETDPSVSSIRSQQWSFGLNFPLEHAWRPWTFPNTSTVAGQIVQWQGNFKHATIRGSGHMVPGYKPYSAFLMLETWLADAEWPALPPATEPDTVPVTMPRSSA